MLIFLMSRDGNFSVQELMRRAYETLRLSLILSARVGGIVDGRPVVFVDDLDVPKAVAVLKRSGIEAVTD
jgi:hypothetical protein